MSRRRNGNVNQTSSMTVAELAFQIRSLEGVGPNPAATSDDILAAEMRLGRTIPSELKECVRVMDGCEGGTPPDQSWTTFWPVRRWRPVAESGSTARFAHAVIFADYCQESWWYAFESTSAGHVRILKINGPDCVVSESLVEFLEAVLHDDPRIFGPQVG